ncbi:MAG: helix-turn-helix transcriptional regulator [Candidatus Gastranaerophilales bacterium]|nr:helix-turn-helix transcriptional regulator [Candidatus Gastranaerophilales bacterium]
MKDGICKQFATKVQEIRQAKGFTKSKLSTLAGLDISYIGKIERCEKSPNLRTIIKLSEALEIPVKDLFDF